MQPKTSLRLSALFGGLAVALGAIGAHLMKNHYGAEDLERFEKGVRYQMYHALALGLCAVLGMLGVRTKAAIFFVGGIVLFSGSLFLLVWTQQKAFGHLTPFGGVSFLVGWVLLALGKKSVEPDRSGV